MPVVTKNKATRSRKKKPGVIDPKVGHYEKHPFVVKKVNEAKAILKAVGLPKKASKVK